MSFWDYQQIVHLQGVVAEAKRAKPFVKERDVPTFEQPLSTSYGPQFVDAPEMKPEDLFD